MPSQPNLREIGLSPGEARALGRTRAAQVRSFRLLIHTAQQLRFLADRMYAADGITTQQAAVLTMVRMLGTPKLTEVASRLAVSHQNVKQIVNVLVRKGLLRFKADAHDGRVWRIVTTRKNERHWAKRDQGDFGSVAAWFGALSPAEVRQLCALLLKLQGSLGAARET